LAQLSRFIITGVAIDFPANREIIREILPITGARQRRNPCAAATLKKPYHAEQGRSFDNRELTSDTETFILSFDRWPTTLYSWLGLPV
jgi:hypothetical protein